ncbi:MAG: hypothetical protein ACLUHE_01740 [Christensenellales bacterium]|jgi:hypothetical protein
MDRNRLDDMEMRAYYCIDEIERGRYIGTRTQYFKIMTMVAFLILDSLLAIRRASCCVALLFFCWILLIVASMI